MTDGAFFEEVIYVSSGWDNMIDLKSLLSDVSV